MIRLITLFTCALMLSLCACQKEVVWNLEDVPVEDTTDDDNPPDTSTSGELAIKALQITLSTGDTNTITLKWDANKRFIEYASLGRVAGTDIDYRYKITRGADGRINKIVSTSAGALVFVDSTVYTVHYKGSTSELDYVTDIQYSFIGNIADSTQYTYDGAGHVASKESFSVFFGTSTAVSKNIYEYDAAGNLVSDKIYTPGGSGYELSATSTYTYNTHKPVVQMGEECFIIGSAANISPNDYDQMVTNAVASGTTYTTVASERVYNSYDRPTSATLNVLPQPPGYAMHVLYYYQ